MNTIRIIDARMGRGKTSAAIEYMSQHSGTKRFLYITPFLQEVNRICEACDFDQPDSDKTTKLAELKHLLWKKKNVASTHALFYLLDEDALDLIRRNNYCLIVDEAIDVIQKVPITSKDRGILLNTMTTQDSDGFLHWIDQTYTGKFDQYKEMADAGSLFVLDTALLCIMNPALLTTFDEVIMMTYLFNGQYQKAYLDYFGFEYKVCGIDSTNGHRFSDEPDCPPPLDYGRLIHIVDDDKMNSVGDNRNALSKSWFDRRGIGHEDIKALRNNLNTFFRRRTHGSANEQLWTCFKSHAHKLYGDRGRFAGSFLQLAAKATNEYRNRKHLAYVANKFVDPNVSKFFAMKDIQIDPDEFALAEMLQWIWRSCIRDDQPIELYIPSRRMRMLLQDWIEKTNKGDNVNDD